MRRQLWLLCRVSPVVTPDGQSLGFNTPAPGLPGCPDTPCPHSHSAQPGHREGLTATPAVVLWLIWGKRGEPAPWLPPPVSPGGQADPWGRQPEPVVPEEAGRPWKHDGNLSTSAWTSSFSGSSLHSGTGAGSKAPDPPASGLPGASGTLPGPDPQACLTVPHTCPHLPAATSLWPMCPHRNLPCFQRFGDGDARRLSSWGRLPQTSSRPASPPLPLCLGLLSAASGRSRSVWGPEPGARAPLRPGCEHTRNPNVHFPGTV